MHQLRFATRAASRSERTRQWIGATRASGLVFEDDHEASIVGGDVGAVRLCSVAMGSHQLLGDRIEGRGDALPIKLIFQEEGECLFEQDGRALLLGPGQWCAYDKTRPYRLSTRAFSRQLAVVPPIRADAPLSRRLMRGHSFLRGPGSVLHATTAATLAAIRALEETDAARLGRILTDLLELTLLADPDEEDPASRDARRRAALDHIERHLADPGLEVSAIAAAVGCSKRTLHKLFLDQGMTVARTIWARRLERSRAELVDPAMAGRTITEIAHHWGFSDSQHFSRAFKVHFGVTPRDCRRRVC